MLERSHLWVRGDMAAGGCAWHMWRHRGDPGLGQSWQPCPSRQFLCLENKRLIRQAVQSSLALKCSLYKGTFPWMGQA